MHLHWMSPGTTPIPSRRTMPPVAQALVLRAVPLVSLTASGREELNFSRQRFWLTKANL